MRRLMLLSFPLLASALLMSCSSAPDTASTEPASSNAVTEPVPSDTVEVQEPAVSEPADTMSGETGSEEDSAPDADAAEAVAPPPAAESAAVAAAPGSVALQSDDDRTIYALGLVLSRNIAEFELSANEVEFVKQALSDAAAGTPIVELETWGPRINELVGARAAAAAERRNAVGAAYLTEAAARAGAERTESGMVYRELTAGSGESPAATDRVSVHYSGTLIDGTEFDSSYSRNEPTEFGLGQVIPCWTEGVQMIRVGGKAELVCPADLAYGSNGQPSIPANSTLIFEVELLAIVN